MLFTIDLDDLLHLIPRYMLYVPQEDYNDLLIERLMPRIQAASSMEPDVGGDALVVVRRADLVQALHYMGIDHATNAVITGTGGEIHAIRQRLTEALEVDCDVIDVTGDVPEPVRAFLDARTVRD